ncbi:hypothetical protein ACMBCN_03400, partial [Candidatus Liberibacter asiaticus]
ILFHVYRPKFIHAVARKNLCRGMPLNFFRKWVTHEFKFHLHFSSPKFPPFLSFFSKRSFTFFSFSIYFYFYFIYLIFVLD